MIIATGTFEKAGEVLMLGLTKQNVKKLMRGQPISRDLRFAGVPYHLFIVFGEDEMEIHRQLRVAQLVTSETVVKESPQLKEDE